MNWLHPFPEGNGRSIQIFMTAVVRRHGRDIDWSCIEHNAELEAARLSIKRDSSGYQRLLSRALTPYTPDQEETKLPFPKRDYES